MSDLVLYDHPGSTNALKVRFLLAELGLEARRVPVALEGGRAPGYRDVHPFGLIPALRVDAGLTITESNTALASSPSTPSGPTCAERTRASARA